jgi:hypothetical protein
MQGASCRGKQGYVGVPERMYRYLWQICLGDKIPKPAGNSIGMNRLSIILFKYEVADLCLQPQPGRLNILPG